MGLFKDLETGKMTLSTDGVAPPGYNSTDPDQATNVNELKSMTGLYPVSLENSKLDIYDNAPKYDANSGYSQEYVPGNKYMDNLPT